MTEEEEEGGGGREGEVGWTGQLLLLLALL